MLDLAERALRLATRRGAEQAEAFVAHNRVLTVRIAGCEVVEAKLVDGTGIGLRVAIGQKVGFACSNRFTPELVRRAMDIASGRPPNPDFKGFPEGARAREVRGMYDRALERLSEEKAVELAELMLTTALEHPSVKDVSGALNLVTERCAIVNTSNVRTSDQATRILGHITAEAREGEKRSEGLGWLGGISLRGFDAAAVGRRATELAVGSLDQTEVKPGKYTVILEPAAAAELFYHVFGYSVNGRDVYDRISYFTDRLNQKVASGELSVCDYGNMPNGLFSKAVDDEGVPTRRTPLVERGVLRGFVYDHLYACKAGTRSTGNGFRLMDMPGRRYEVEPTPSLTNLVIEPGDRKPEELVRDTKRGLLLSRIWYTYPVVPQRGDFSTTSRCGFLIQRGEIVGAVKQVRIHENLPKLLVRINGVASNVESTIPWGASAAVCSPSLRFEGVRVT